jgi:hypothetical protein
MLGDVITVEAGILGGLQQRDALVVGLLQRLVAKVDVVENTELHHMRPG